MYYLRYIKLILNFQSRDQLAAHKYFKNNLSPY